MIYAERRLQLAARRALLVQRAADERQRLAQAALPLAPAWRRAERGLQIWRELRQRPWLLALPAAVMLWWRPRGTLSLLTAMPALWRAAQSALNAQRALRR